MRIKNKGLLLKCIAIPLVVGGLSAWISGGSMKIFEEVNKPPLSPPGWLFPVVWTILYTLMGIASYLVVVSGQEQVKVGKALRLYAAQLAVNFVWPILFFNLQWFFLAFLWLVLLWILIFLTIKAFYEVSPKAAALLLPYLIWVTFAGYLNLGIWLLN